MSFSSKDDGYAIVSCYNGKSQILPRERIEELAKEIEVYHRDIIRQMISYVDGNAARFLSFYQKRVKFTTQEKETISELAGADLNHDLDSLVETLTYGISRLNTREAGRLLLEDVRAEENFLQEELQHLENGKIKEYGGRLQYCRRFSLDLRKSMKAEENNVHTMISSHILFVIHQARGVFEQLRNERIDYGDLVQEGMKGLVRAVDRFDYRRKMSLTTYANWLIMSDMYAYLSRNMNALRIPYLSIQKMRRFLKEKEDTADLDDDEAAKRAGMSRGMLDNIAIARMRTISLYEPLDSEGSITLEEAVADKTVIVPGDGLDGSKLQQTVREILKTLPPRQEKVIRMRFGMGEERDYTLQEIADDFHLTKQRIKQIEGEAMKKLRRRLARARLAPFL